MRRTAPHMLELVLLRNEQGLSQADVGDRIGLSPATVSNVEAGLNLRLPHLLAYANLFGRDVKITYPIKADNEEPGRLLRPSE